MPVLKVEADRLQKETAKAAEPPRTEASTIKAKWPLQGGAQRRRSVVRLPSKVTREAKIDRW
jgi:hypothetical protein